MPEPLSHHTTLRQRYQTWKTSSENVTRASGADKRTFSHRVSIQRQGGSDLLQSNLKKQERWAQTTASALRMLALNFPASECAREVVAEGWGELRPTHFPCQKSDRYKPCPGWTWTSVREGLGPFKTSLCPCSHGRKMLLAPLLELAGEFLGEYVPTEADFRRPLSAFSNCSSGSALKTELLKWMYWGASQGFVSKNQTNWLDEFVEFSLEEGQRQALRWWARLVELNQLVFNSVFTFLTNRSLENLYAQGQLVAMSRVIRQLNIGEEDLVILCLLDDHLQATGYHSSRNHWLESFVSLIDEHRLNLVLIAKQPLMQSRSHEFNQSKSHAEFRFKARHGDMEFKNSLESILRQGTWDRLTEALARGDHILTQRRN